MKLTSREKEIGREILKAADDHAIVKRIAAKMINRADAELFTLASRMRLKKIVNRLEPKK